jgi:3-oxoacyl-[acyl-carrier protein] reductase
VIAAPTDFQHCDRLRFLPRDRRLIWERLHPTVVANRFRRRQKKNTRSDFMERLSGQVALVTGASRGIGRAIAIALAREGATVAINYRSRESDASQACAEIERLGGRAAGFQADVSRAAEVSRLIAEVERRLGPVSVLVNNAGISRRQPIAEISERDFDEVLTTNLKSAFLVTQAVLPGMRRRRWGRIINVSSIAAQNGGVVGPHYASSKAGMIGLTHSYASLLVKEGITVNAIAPALIGTDMIRDIANPERIPMGRFGTSEEVADVAVVLATNGFITGQTVNVNGGWHMS